MTKPTALATHATEPCTPHPARAALAALAAAAALLAACDDAPRGAEAKARVPAATAHTDARTLVLEVAFSSEKRAWAEEAIAQFNASSPRGADGRALLVRAEYTGSVEPLADIAAGRARPHVFSPASTLVVPLLENAWVAAHGPGARPVAATSEPLVLSPVVIATWRPMAEALGWPDRPLGWHEVAELARRPQGWRALGHPEWGDFRFGHTHPGASNSGLIAVLAENYAALDRVRDLTAADVQSAPARAFVRDVESAVVHYGRSTGFFFDQMAAHGPRYLSAAVLYENLVVTAEQQPAGGAPLPFPLVCLYPREGTLWADHPYIVLDAPWVGPAERDAAARLRALLLSPPVQRRAMSRYGFRPANTDVPLAAPIDAAHGADPRAPQTLLATPDARTVQAALEAWRASRRAVSLTLVFDRSGSMAGAPLEAARAGLAQLLGTLAPTDRAQLITFASAPDPPTAPAAPAALAPRVRGIFADGGTALYDAVDRARALAEAAARDDRTHIHAVVVLTDGEDRDSRTTLPALLARVAPAESGSPVRIFTIGYGAAANERVLRQIAERTGGAYYHGDAATIRAVYDEIGAFF